MAVGLGQRWMVEGAIRPKTLYAAKSGRMNHDLIALERYGRAVSQRPLDSDLELVSVLGPACAWQACTIVGATIGRLLDFYRNSNLSSFPFPMALVGAIACRLGLPSWHLLFDNLELPQTP